MSAFFRRAIAILLCCNLGLADGDSQNDEREKELKVLCNRLKSNDYSVRQRAAEEIGKIGRDAESVTRNLCEALVDRHAKVRQAASEALEEVNPEFRELVLPITADRDRDERISHIQKVHDLGPEGIAALPVVSHRLDTISKMVSQGRSSKSANEREFLACMDAMFAIGRDEEEVCKVFLTAASKGATPAVRGYAMARLPAMGLKDTKRAISILAVAAKTDTKENKITALNSLSAYGTLSKSTTDTIRQLKGNRDSKVREAADRALKKIEDAIAQGSDTRPANEPDDAGAESEEPEEKKGDEGMPKEAAESDTVFLSDLEEKSVEVWHYNNIKEFGFGKNGKLWEAGGWKQIVLGGKESPKGIETHPTPKGQASVSYDIGELGKAVFRATVGVADIRRYGPASPISFEVYGDGKPLWSSKPVAKWGEPQECEVKIGGVKKLELRVVCPGDAAFARAVWCEPRLCEK